MSLKIKLHFLLVLIGIFLSSLTSAKASLDVFFSDTMRHEMTWFDKNDTILFFPVCGADGNSYLNPSEAKFFGVNSWTEGPCHAYGEVLSIEPEAFWIEEITLNEVSNTSSSTPIGFSDYTNIVLEVHKNEVNTFLYKSNAIRQKEESVLSIWIDFNKNGNFEASELLAKEKILTDEGGISFSIPVSVDLFLVTRMRIICGVNEHIVNDFIAKGEVEDYSIIVVE